MTKLGFGNSNPSLIFSPGIIVCYLYDNVLCMDKVLAYLLASFGLAWISFLTMAG